MLGLAGCASQDDTNLARVGKMTQKQTSRRAQTYQPTAPAPSAAPALPVARAPYETPSAPSLAPQPTGKLQVAILLPLSGKHAALGQAMLNAAQMAVFDMGSSAFELMPRDTAGSPEMAATAARDAIASGAKLIIGPLFAADVAAVKPVVQTSSVNMLALSTDASLAEPGAYVMGFAPAPQVQRVIAFAAHQGAQRFAALIPPGPYGKLVEKAFEAEVRQQGGTIAALEPLDKAAALIAKKDSFDTLFLPLSVGEVRKIAPALQAAGIDGTSKRLLGTGLWDEGVSGQNLPLLTGGWYAAPDPAARAHFTENYAKTYSKEPPRLVTLAYDATALAAVLAGRGGSFDRIALGNPNGFAGVDGIFRLTSAGQADRGLAILALSPDGAQVVDPAPTTFLP